VAEDYMLKIQKNTFRLNLHDIFIVKKRLIPLKQGGGNNTSAEEIPAFHAGIYSVEWYEGLRMKWERQKALVERIITNTPFEPMVRGLWGELRSIGRPHLRQARREVKHIAQIISRIVGENSNCVDIGCNKGHILWYILKFAPNGNHFAFEPIPALVQYLKERFPHVHIYELALSDFTGETNFYHVVNCPGLSGFHRQIYHRLDEEVKEIKVRTENLDNILPEGLKIHFIKIDVEGAELLVFRGAVRTIKRDKPFILFEHGSNFTASYGLTSEMVYDLLVDQCSLNISLMSDWLEGKAPLSRQAFISQAAIHYNFLAHP
jgi:FkbM family methyltransferase